MTRHTQLALMLCVAVAGTAVEARADCHKVRGSIAETSIPSKDQFGRLLGTVTGVLNGASTVFITSPSCDRGGNSSVGRDNLLSTAHCSVESGSWAMPR